MDAKIKKILQGLNNQIDSNELATALKADNFEGEYALSEDGVKSIIEQTQGLLSIESAVNNQEIIEKISKDLYPKHMKSALTKVEDQLKPLFEKLGIDYTKYEFPSDAIKDIEPKIMDSGSGDNKELINSLNEDLRKAKEEIASKEQQFEEELKKRDNEFLMDKIRQKFKSKATEKQWAEAYSLPDVHDAIMDKVWNKVTAKAHLKLTDEGDIVPMQKEFPDKELYNGNKVESFQSLLEPLIEPYLKKSAPDEPKKNVSNDGKQLSPEEQRRIELHKKQKERYN